MMEGIIRNAIAAIAIVLSLGTTLGTALVKMNNSVVELQFQVSQLSAAVQDLRCEITPRQRGCRDNVASPYN